jgi:uncharacterized protein YqfA (UPF0365 family)
MMAFWSVTVALVVSGFLLVVSRYFSLWLQAYVSGTRIGLISLVMMTLRNVDPRLIVHCKVMAVQAGIADIPTNAIEAQFLAGGNVERVTLALIAANRAGIELDWNTAAAIDLAGRDILDAVRASVNPRVINCPEPGTGRSETLDGVAQDGIQLMVRVRVTVRTNVAQLIGGATEATVIARVGEGIVSAIGSCKTYLEALADPHVITRRVLSQGLDSQTAFSIVSIDIADISVGKNIGAVLRIDRADTDIRIARAAAETRRAAAVARQQEMVALTVENQAAVVEAEALVPHAVAAAFRVHGLSTARAGFSHRSMRYRPVSPSPRSAERSPK